MACEPVRRTTWRWNRTSRRVAAIAKLLDGDAERGRLHGAWIAQAPGGVDENKNGRARDQGRLRHGAGALGLAMAEAVAAIRRLLTDMNGDEGDGRGNDVGQAVDQRRQDRQRAGSHGGRQLEQGEQSRQGQACCGGEPLQPRWVGRQQAAREPLGAGSAVGEAS